MCDFSHCYCLYIFILSYASDFLFQDILSTTPMTHRYISLSGQICCGLKNLAQPRIIWTSLKIWGVGRKCSVRHQWMGERDAHCLTSRSARCRGGHWWPSPLCTAYLCSDSQCTTQCTLGCTCSLTRCIPMTCPPPSPVFETPNL